MFDLTGKTALVTGASGGIGGAIARALHAQGANVGLSRHARPSALEKLRRSWASARMCCRPISAIRRRSKRLLKAAEAALGGIDILVNNAGLTRDNLAMRMKDEDWQKVIDVNLTAGFRLARGGDARHDEEALGPHHRHHLDRRRHRQSRPGQLCGGQGGHDRHVQVAGPGGGEPQHHGQLRGARLHRDRR